MQRSELEAFCDDNDIDFAETDEKDANGKGILFHWNNPRDKDDGECLHVTDQVFESTTPQQLLKEIIHGRDVKHMTRVVGYYSMTHNWNNSKLGELKDRRKGNYSIGGRS